MAAHKKPHRSICSDVNVLARGAIYTPDGSNCPMCRDYIPSQSYIDYLKMTYGWEYLPAFVYHEEVTA